MQGLARVACIVPACLRVAWCLLSAAAGGRQVGRAAWAPPACRFGPVSIEHLQAAQRPAYDGRMYKVRLHASRLLARPLPAT